VLNFETEWGGRDAKGGIKDWAEQLQDRFVAVKGPLWVRLD